MHSPRTAEIAQALTGPNASTLSSEHWGAMYEKLWKVHDETLDLVEHLKMQLLFYAGKDSRWSN